MSASASRGLRLVNATLVAASVAVLLVTYHLWGNTADPKYYGISAFQWLHTVWYSTRMYGGSAFVIGWFIPLLTLALLWRDRRELRAIVKSPSWAGFAVVLLALLMHWMGLRSQQTRLSWIALVLMAWAIPFHLYGGPTARRIAPAFALLLFLVPFNFLDVFTFPLQRIAAAVAAGLLSGLGLPFARNASQLQFQPTDPGDAPLPPIDGADAGGGIGIVLTLGLVAAFLWAWKRRRFRHGAVVMATVPVVATLANTLRLIVAALAQAAGGEAAGRIIVDHVTLWLVGLFGIAGLLAIDALPAWWKRKKPWKLLEPTRPPIE